MSNTIDIFTEIQAHTGAVVSSEITAQIHNEADVFTEITVPVKVENSMQAKFFLYGSGYKEVLTEVVPRAIRENTIEAEFYTRAIDSKDIRSDIDIVHRGVSDIFTEIQPMGYVQIEAEIEVRPHTNMTAIYEVMKPPILTMTSLPSHDSFTKKEAAFQTINYGKSSTMVIGNNDEFESFLSFDTGKLDSRYIITDISLELTYMGEIADGYNINLHTTSRSWNETGITYRNRPSKLDLVSNQYKIDRSRRVISFDVKDTVSKWLSNEVENNGFVLSTTNVNPTYFRTRNAGAEFSPRLVVKYYDSVVPSLGRSSVRSELFIAYRGNKDILSEIEVDSTYSFEKVPVELYVHRYDTPVESEIYAEITAHNPDVTAVITAARSDQSRVPAVVYVRSEEQARSKDAVIRVTRDAALTEVSARQQAEKPIDADIHVSRNKILSELSVSVEDRDEIFAVIEANDIHVNYIQAEIVPRAIRNDDILVEIEPNIKSDILTEITAIYRGNDDVSTEISPRAIGINEVLVEIDPIFKSVTQAEVSVSRPEVLAQIRAVIRGDSDVHTVITPRVEGQDRVDADIAVNRREIQVGLGVRAFMVSDVDTEISVQCHENSVILTDIAVRRDHLLTDIGVRAIAISDKHAEITVQRNEENVIYAEVSVKRDQIEVEITPRHFVHSDIMTEIAVQRYEDSEKLAEIYVKHTSDVLTEIDVVGASTVPAEITMSRQTIKTEIMVPFGESADLLTEIAPRVLFANDVHCQITMGKVSKGYAFIL